MYKQFLAAAALFTLCVSAHASSPLLKEEFEECQRTENSAKQVMKARQQGVPMSTLWELAENTGNEYVSKLFKMLIREAYEIPQYTTENLQQRAITDFQNNFFKACIVTAEKKYDKND